MQNVKLLIWLYLVQFVVRKYGNFTFFRESTLCTKYWRSQCGKVVKNTIMIFYGKINIFSIKSMHQWKKFRNHDYVIHYQLRLQLILEGWLLTKIYMVLSTCPFETWIVVMLWGFFMTIRLYFGKCLNTSCKQRIAAFEMSYWVLKMNFFITQPWWCQSWRNLIWNFWR